MDMVHTSVGSLRKPRAASLIPPLQNSWDGSQTAWAATSRRTGSYGDAPHGPRDEPQFSSSGVRPTATTTTAAATVVTTAAAAAPLAFCVSDPSSPLVTIQSRQASYSVPVAPRDPLYQSQGHSQATAAAQRQREERLVDIKESLVSLLASLRESRAACDAQDEEIARTTKWFPSQELISLHEMCVMLLKQCTLMEEVVVRSVILEAARRYALQTGSDVALANTENTPSPIHTFRLPQPCAYSAHNKGSTDGAEKPVPLASVAAVSPSRFMPPAALSSEASSPSFATAAGDTSFVHSVDGRATPPPPSSSVISHVTASMSGLRRFVDLELCILQNSASAPLMIGASSVTSPCASVCAITHESVSASLGAGVSVCHDSGSPPHAHNVLASAKRGAPLLLAVPSAPDTTESSGSLSAGVSLSTVPSAASAARSSWHEFLLTLTTVWQELKLSFPIDTHYYDALDFLRTWGPEWYAFEQRCVPGEEPLHVGVGGGIEARATQELMRRLTSREATRECFGALFAKIVRIVETSSYGCQKSVPLSTLMRA